MSDTNRQPTNQAEHPGARILPLIELESGRIHDIETASYPHELRILRDSNAFLREANFALQQDRNRFQLQHRNLQADHWQLQDQLAEQDRELALARDLLEHTVNLLNAERAARTTGQNPQPRASHLVPCTEDEHHFCSCRLYSGPHEV